jgi:stage V sporulation protein R
MKPSLTYELQVEREKIEAHARAYGLDFFDTFFELVDFEQMNMVAAYGGFPTRYPHWRFGMEYEQLAKGYAYGLQKIYELVINNDPSYAYLLNANHLVDQKLVMAHVFGHVDFFKHNAWFAPTNRKMMDEMANHGSRIRRYIQRYGEDTVEQWLDVCLSLDNLIDFHAPFIRRQAPGRHESGRIESADPRAAYRLKSKSYMEHFVNPDQYLDEMVQREQDRREEMERTRRFPEKPEKDVLWFLLNHAPLADWQADVLSIVRDEAYYFAPQGQTKVMNEGWACLAPETRVFTEIGLITMAELVDGQACIVSDGENHQRVYDRHIISQHPTVEIRTRRGLRLKGSNNHRVMRPDRVSWCRLDELTVGSRLAISGGQGLWPQTMVRLSWRLPERVTLDAVAKNAGTSVWSVLRHRAGHRSPLFAGAISTALEPYEAPENQCLSTHQQRRTVVPTHVDADLAAFLGYLVGDGHISRVKHHLGLTTGDLEQAERFAALGELLFGLTPVQKLDGKRWRVLFHAETLSDFLVEACGLTTGPSAREKRVPDVILRSPEPVVRAFLRALYDCDGYADRQGVILSSSSDELSQQVQLLLLNYGILSRRRPHKDGCWHVHVAGHSAARFADVVGFGLSRKQAALERYVGDRQWFKAETWDDEVVEITHGRADVYDISVTETHRYAAGGFINHNSYWHTTIMTNKVLDASEVVDYADHHSGTVAISPGRLNPYALGLALWRDIEDRWNKGRFGKAWDECDDQVEKRRWDLETGLGREKIFQVRRIHNDITFIDEYLTPDFCREHKLFHFRLNPATNQYEISDREFETIKQQLLFSLTNFGQPFITVVDGNYGNRGELYLQHRHEGLDLKADYVPDTLRNAQAVWRRPVNIETVVDGLPKVIRFDGQDFSETVL